MPSERARTQFRPFLIVKTSGQELLYISSSLVGSRVSCTAGKERCLEMGVEWLYMSTDFLEKGGSYCRKKNFFEKSLIPGIKMILHTEGNGTRQAFGERNYW